METLRVVEATGDGHLVLASPDGRRFRLELDADVRAAVRRSVRPPGTEPGRGDERAGPREVQARIRAGADAESVAEATGLDVEYVRRFEGPALAERVHVAEIARSSPVHRDRASRPVPLETAALSVLTEEGFDVASVAWDSRRVEGSRWDVVLRAVAGAPPGPSDGAAAGVAATGAAPAPAAATLVATWRFDVATRALEELDDGARLLTRLDLRRLAPVRDHVFDIEDGRAGRARRAAGEDVAPELGASGTSALLEALAHQRGRRPRALVADLHDDGHDGHDGHDHHVAAGTPAADAETRDRPASGGAPVLPGTTAGTTAGTATGTAPAPSPDGRQPAHEAAAPARARTIDLDAVRATQRRTSAPPVVDVAPPGHDLDDAAVAAGHTAPAGVATAPALEPVLRGAPTAAGADPGGRTATGRAEPAAGTAGTVGADPAAAPDTGGDSDGHGDDRPGGDNGSGAGGAAVPAARAPRSRRPAPRRTPAPRQPERRPSDAAAPGGDGPGDTAVAERRARRRRATVPSWDDIVFGARQDDDA